MERLEKLDKIEEFEKLKLHFIKTMNYFIESEKFKIKEIEEVIQELKEKKIPQEAVLTVGGEEMEFKEFKKIPQESIGVIAKGRRLIKETEKLIWSDLSDLQAINKKLKDYNDFIKLLRTRRQRMIQWKN